MQIVAYIRLIPEIVVLAKFSLTSTPSLRLPEGE